MNVPSQTSKHVVNSFSKYKPLLFDSFCGNFSLLSNSMVVHASLIARGSSLEIENKFTHSGVGNGFQFSAQLARAARNTKPGLHTIAAEITFANLKFLSQVVCNLHQEHAATCVVGHLKEPPDSGK